VVEFNLFIYFTYINLSNVWYRVLNIGYKKNKQIRIILQEHQVGYGFIVATDVNFS